MIEEGIKNNCGAEEKVQVKEEVLSKQESGSGTGVSEMATSCEIFGKFKLIIEQIVDRVERIEERIDIDWLITSNPGKDPETKIEEALTRNTAQEDNEKRIYLKENLSQLGELLNMLRDRVSVKQEVNVKVEEEDKADNFEVFMEEGLEEETENTKKVLETETANSSNESRSSSSNQNAELLKRDALEGLPDTDSSLPFKKIQQATN